MRHLKTYKIFESSQELTPEQEKFLDEFTEGTWSINPSTGLVDIDGHFSCSSERLGDFNGIRFGDVSGNFLCSNNRLMTLEGAPREVRGDFWCHNNRLMTLEGAPRKVEGDFYCSNNKLTSLEEAPEEVVGNFYCDYNTLTSLEGAPREVGGNFGCHHNRLTSLEGAPETIGGEFYFNSKVQLPKGDWSIQSLVDLYETLNGEDKTLVGTLVSPEALQKRIDKSPAKAAVQLKGILHLPQYKDLKWPKHLEDDLDLMKGLHNLGL